MNHEKTFAAIQKLREVEIEMHRLKNALEMANKAPDAKHKREWVGLTEEEMIQMWYENHTIMGWYSFQEIVRATEAKLKEKNVQ